MADNVFGQLESLLALSASIDSGKYEEIIGGIAEKFKASAARDIADAVETIGPELADRYIVPSRASIRAKQALDKYEYERKKRQLELQVLEAEAATKIAAAAKIQEHTKALQPKPKQ